MYLSEWFLKGLWFVICDLWFVIWECKCWGFLPTGVACAEATTSHGEASGKSSSSHWSACLGRSLPCCSRRNDCHSWYQIWLKNIKQLVQHLNCANVIECDSKWIFLRSHDSVDGCFGLFFLSFDILLCLIPLFGILDGKLLLTLGINPNGSSIMGFCSGRLLTSSIQPPPLLRLFRLENNIWKQFKCSHWVIK